MRHLVFYSLCFTIFSTLAGCGQSGALMLPSDPNYDKRSQYILHKSDTAVATTDISDNTQPTDQN